MSRSSLEVVEASKVVLGRGVDLPPGGGGWDPLLCRAGAQGCQDLGLMVSSTERGQTSFVRTALGHSYTPFLRPGRGLPGRQPLPNPLWTSHDAISL